MYMKRVIFELEYLRGVPFRQMKGYYVDVEIYNGMFSDELLINPNSESSRLKNINIINTPTIQGEVEIKEIIVNH